MINEWQDFFRSVYSLTHSPEMAQNNYAPDPIIWLRIKSAGDSQFPQSWKVSVCAKVKGMKIPEHVSQTLDPLFGGTRWNHLFVNHQSHYGLHLRPILTDRQTDVSRSMWRRHYEKLIRAIKDSNVRNGHPGPKESTLIILSVIAANRKLFLG